jgi:predicted metal-dependent hydrolase
MFVPFDYTLIKKKIKNASIKITFDRQIIISVPLRYSKSDIKVLIDKKLGWIEKTLRKLESTREKISLKPDQILLFGKTYSKKLNPALKNKVIVNFNNETIDTDLNLSNRKIQAEWYKFIAKEYFSRRVSELAQKHDLTYNRITVRGQKTRWGSCSARKNLSFNWKLMKAPHFVIDYIIIHELAHTRHLNHSKSYWRNVQNIMPDYQKSEEWLKKFGGNL